MPSITTRFLAETDDLESKTKRAQDSITGLNKVAGQIGEKKAGRGVEGLVRDLSNARSASDVLFASLNRLEKPLGGLIGSAAAGLGVGVGVSLAVSLYEVYKKQREEREKINLELEKEAVRISNLRGGHAGALEGAEKKFSEMESITAGSGTLRKELAAAREALNEAQTPKHGAMAVGWGAAQTELAVNPVAILNAQQELARLEILQTMEAGKFASLQKSAVEALERQQNVVAMIAEGRGEEAKQAEITAKYALKIYEANRIGATELEKSYGLLRDMEKTSATIFAEQKRQALENANKLGAANLGVTGSAAEKKIQQAQNEANDLARQARERYLRGGDNAEEEAEALSQKSDAKRKEAEGLLEAQGDKLRTAQDALADALDLSEGDERILNALRRKRDAAEREQGILAERGELDELAAYQTEANIANLNRDIADQEAKMAEKPAEEEEEAEQPEQTFGEGKTVVSSKARVGLGGGVFGGTTTLENIGHRQVELLQQIAAAVDGSEGGRRRGKKENLYPLLND